MLDGADMKELRYLQLWDCYGALLTEHQREIFELYYTYDLSLTEIAEQNGCSKQSISDTLSKARALLEEYEEKLHFNALNLQYGLEVSEMMTRVTRALGELKAKHPELTEEITAIQEMVTVGEVITADER